MPQISVDALDTASVFIVVDITNMLARINYVNIAQIAVSSIVFSGRSGVNQRLYPLRRFVERCVNSHYLSRVSAHNRDNIAIFTSFASAFLPDKPVKLVNFQYMVIVFQGCPVFFIQLYTFALLKPKIFPTPRPLTPA